MSTNHRTSQNFMCWFARPFPRERARIRLFCFPYAGGGTEIFREWPKGLRDSIEVVPVALPGRGPRLLELPFTSMEALVHELFTAIHPLLDRPFVFFGHSMGALIAFELAHLMQADGVLPKTMVLSACPAPHLSFPIRVVQDMNDEELTRRLSELRGTSERVLNNEELLRLVLPVLRADFEMVEKYRFQLRRPLQCPFLVCGGRDDFETPPHLLEGWSQHTSRGTETRFFEGDHFFLAHRTSELLDWILKKVNTSPE